MINITLEKFNFLNIIYVGLVGCFSFEGNRFIKDEIDNCRI
jgi:hypothetical protein